MSNPVPPNAGTETSSDSSDVRALVSQPSGRKRKLLWAATGTVILGAVGSGLWDLIVKPGVSGFGRLILGVITFGSTTLRDSAYLSAALDPTPLPSLVILVVLAGAVSYVAFRLSVSALVRTFAKKGNEGSAGEAEKKEDRKKGLRRIPVILFIAINLLFAFGILISVSILNQAILIHRVFFANISICSPYLSPEEEQQFRARFASVKTRDDYKTHR